MYIYIYTHVYIEREIERERDRKRESSRPVSTLRGHTLTKHVSDVLTCWYCDVFVYYCLCLVDCWVPLVMFVYCCVDCSCCCHLLNTHLSH